MTNKLELTNQIVELTNQIVGHRLLNRRFNWIINFSECRQLKETKHRPSHLRLVDVLTMTHRKLCVF